MKVDYYKVFRRDEGKYYVVLVNERGFMIQVRQWAYSDEFPAFRRHTARAGVLKRGWKPINLDEYDAYLKIDSYDVKHKRENYRRPKE